MKGKGILAACLALSLFGVVAVRAAEEAGKAGKTHEVSTEIVSVDMKASTITIKDEKGASKTVPVLGAAIAMLKDLKTGEKVRLTCKDNEKGEHEGVTAIKVEPAAPKHG